MVVVAKVVVFVPVVLDVLIMVVVSGVAGVVVAVPLVVAGVVVAVRLVVAGVVVS